MSEHFSYLLDEPAGDFFQKVACEDAESMHGVPVPRPEPEAMQKQASAPSPFEKLAGRLDRDMFILKTAGACGWGLGMVKRADAYMDVVMSQCDMTVDEFGEIFDKVASEAILIDLQAAYEDACADTEPGLHYIVERNINKLGYDLTKIAQMEKEAVLAWIARGLGALRGARGATVAAKAMRTGGAARAGITQGIKNVTGKALHHAGRPVRAVGRAIERKAKGISGAYRAGKATAAKKALSGMHKELAGARAMAGRATKGSATQAAATRQAALTEKAIVSKGKEMAGGRMPMRAVPGVTKTRGGATAQPAAAPKGTTAPKGDAVKTTSEAGKAKQTKAELETQQAQTKAREATEAPKTPSGDKGGDVLDIKTGKPPTGGAQPSPSATPSPSAAADTATKAGAPKGIIDKIMNQGVGSLTTSEKVQAGLGAYVGAKVVFGD